MFDDHQCECLAASLAPFNLRDEARNRDLVHYIDNRGAEKYFEGND